MVERGAPPVELVKAVEAKPNMSPSYQLIEAESPEAQTVINPIWQRAVNNLEDTIVPKGEQQGFWSVDFFRPTWQPPENIEESNLEPLLRRRTKIIQAMKARALKREGGEGVDYDEASLSYTLMSPEGRPEKGQLLPTDIAFALETSIQGLELKINSLEQKEEVPGAELEKLRELKSELEESFNSLKECLFVSPDVEGKGLEKYEVWKIEILQPEAVSLAGKGSFGEISAEEQPAWLSLAEEKLHPVAEDKRFSLTKLAIVLEKPATPESAEAPVETTEPIGEERAAELNRVNKSFEEKAAALIKSVVRKKEKLEKEDYRQIDQARTLLITGPIIELRAEDSQQVANVKMAIKSLSLPEDDPLMAEVREISGIENPLQARKIIADFIDAQLQRIPNVKGLTPEERDLIEIGIIDPARFAGQSPEDIAYTIRKVIAETGETMPSQLTNVSSLLNKLKREQVLDSINQALFANFDGIAVAQRVTAEFQKKVGEALPPEIVQKLNEIPFFFKKNWWLLALVLTPQMVGVFASLIAESEGSTDRSASHAMF